MYIAHGPISYILNESIQKKKILKLKTEQQLLVMIFSILFGILPDIDILLLRIVNIPSFSHHLIFTHSIALYLSLWFLLNIFFWLLKRILNERSRKVLTDELLNIIQLSFLIGTMSHFFADILFSYSRILFPIERQFTILGSIFPPNYFASYIFNPTFAVEILLSFLFVLMLYKKYLKEIKLVRVSLYLLISLSTILFCLNIFMNLNTYNKASHFVKNSMVLDKDYDKIHDRYDWDTDGDGVSNILEIDREEMITFIKSISTGRYLVSSDVSFLNKIASSFGGFNSYRILSQAYFEQNLALEPVLIDYFRKENSLDGYSMEMSYIDTLYQYLKQYGIESDMDTPGGIYFVLDGNENIINMGVVIDSEKVSTVLGDDKRLILHSKSEILDIYGDRDIKVLSIP